MNDTTIQITQQEYRTIIRNDFVTFTERAFYELNPQTQLLLAPYIYLIGTHLENCRTGITKRLIINLPPRYLKSHCASVCMPAWLLAHDPSARIICASYGQDLADNLALESRKLMQSTFYQTLFATRLDPRKMAVNDFMTTKGGGRMATSVGGVLTGRGADFIILDDPMKPDDALSQTRRQSVNDWYDNTLLSRLNDKKNGCIILIMQRLHQDDLVGHALEHGNWTVLNLPAIAEQDELFEITDLLGTRSWQRQEGEPLHSERETIEMLKATKARIGNFNFSSQYQQNPSPVGGSIIKSNWIMRYDKEQPLPEGISMTIQSWDTAHKAGDLNDYSVCVTVMMIEEHYYILDVHREKLDYPTLKKRVIEKAEQFEPRPIVIEDKSSGTSLIQELQQMYRYKIVPYVPPAGTDKVMRLHAVSDLFEAGLVYLPNQAPWLEAFEHELLTFPGTRYDDQVDATSQALAHLRQRGNRAMMIWAKLAD
ncbi:phage terminase large subunit [Polynucleobacter brandtiae]|uniref:Putative phage terminase large subunit-like protein n=1 Tax=Polynucleobacter brandtiae TaxID=1938816 RepID=A0A2M8VJG5_9BURK|nr:phage terminase large subunit [Polynucleobacter brandtiae]PJI77145.1 putative phage terminase large subunit-like protein [Polynucleobacter brandtiae]